MEFFVGLRNKVEHRFAREQQALSAAVSGQAEGEKAPRRLRKQLPASVHTFIAEYDANLESSVSDDPRYELQLRVFQELAPEGP